MEREHSVHIWKFMNKVFLTTPSELRQIVDLGSKIFSTRVQIQYLRLMSNLGISV